MLSAYQWWTYIIASHLVKSKLNKRQKKKNMNTQSTDENIFHQFQPGSFCLASGYRLYLHSKHSDQYIYHLFAYLSVDQHCCPSKPKVSQSLWRLLPL